jgi:hypothetical protein
MAFLWSCLGDSARLAKEVSSLTLATTLLPEGQPCRNGVEQTAEVRTVAYMHA